MDLRQLTDEVEAVSRAYARRHGITQDATWFLLKLQEEVGELTQAYLMRTGQARTKELTAGEIDEGFRAELADVLCQVLLLARHHEVDLPTEVARKWLRWKPAVDRWTGD
ncbi:MazG nucleotide pyrophosphohydrolase domain-containing protein [Micromonospora cathayae]|uniref:MazG nucleotide pyrophosphohydrolase domain-containing protein n=1 Tax=Micromonospora cathayae TaxID=3028804 RepID=A0ABY7ZUB5_9ACTN|nr:MazG nucleotide pyrophosphohydrolase domain-containing protein [Micromonospora sp. HUAS 3]WDZ86416.1 MazG nucleotide pyrophosphohydrolase domain-containing protein [Micromonospora sp. HUAS 3]